MNPCESGLKIWGYMVIVFFVCVFVGEFYPRVIFKTITVFFLHMIQGGSIVSHFRSQRQSQARAGLSSLTRSPLHLCRGHSLVMWSAVCLSAPHSREADGASPIWFMLCLNLLYPAYLIETLVPPPVSVG